MKNNEFFICEEDNVFDQLSALYENIQPSVYHGAPSLDPDLAWDVPQELYVQDSLSISEEYGSPELDIQWGDILLASVYQENAAARNLNHAVRPFLVVYTNATRVYGFQLSTQRPASLEKYVVEVPNYADCGLPRPSNFILNAVRSVEYFRIVKRIGHINETQKQAVLNKLYEIQENKDGFYSDWYVDQFTGIANPKRITMTIQNVERIRC